LLFSLPHAGGQQPVSQDLLHVNPWTLLTCNHIHVDEW
jgi:hypothetical protein